MRLAICGDEQDCVKRIGEIIFKYYAKISVLYVCEEFISAFTLLKRYKATCHDAVFIDASIPNPLAYMITSINIISYKKATVHGAIC